MITAIEFIENKFPNNNGVFVLRNIEEFMIEFAQMHVTEALKQASKKALVYADEGGYSEFVDEDSILNAYPLTNIK
jgi:hypothetical protein